MGFICRHKRHGAVLALIALALQIVLAFGKLFNPNTGVVIDEKFGALNTLGI